MSLFALFARCRNGRILAAPLAAVLSIPPYASAEEESDKEKPEPPQVLLCSPLGGVLGETITVKARGLRLEEATQVKSDVPGVSLKFLKAEKSPVPANLNAERAGDTQVEFELALTDQVRGETAELTFITPQGEAAYRLPLAEVEKTRLEVEPNPGFDQPQEIAFPQVVLGRIENPRDVDVYAVRLEAGEPIHIRIEAEVHGSAIDSLLTVTDDQGTPLAVNDDHHGSRDSRIDFVPPASGRHLIVVQDANDRGGEAHPYRLVVAHGEPPVSFVNQVVPLLREHCVGCHGPSTAEGGYRLDSYERLLQAGDSGEAGIVAHRPEAGESYRRITTDEPSARMPLDADPLPAESIAVLRRWIEEGAVFDGDTPDASLVSLMPAVEHPAAPEHYAAPLPLIAIAFSTDGERLLVGGYHEITIWDVGEGTLQQRIGQVARQTHAIAWHPSGEQFAVAGGDPGRLGEVRIFSAEGDLLRVAASADDVIHDAAYSPEGERLAVAGPDGAVRIFDTASGDLAGEITGHLDWITAVAWSPDGSKIATGSRDKTAKVFDVASGRLLASYNRHDAAVRGVLFHPTGEEVYSAGDNGRWDRWKIENAERVRDMHLGAPAFKLVAANDRFLVPSTNNRVYVMKAAESDRIRELHGAEEQPFLSVAVHQASDRVAAGSRRGTVSVWNFSDGQRTAEFAAVPVAPSQE